MNPWNQQRKSISIKKKIFVLVQESTSLLGIKNVKKFILTKNLIFSTFKTVPFFSTKYNKTITNILWQMIRNPVFAICSNLLEFFNKLKRRRPTNHQMKKKKPWQNYEKNKLKIENLFKEQKKKLIK